MTRRIQLFLAVLMSFSSVFAQRNSTELLLEKLQIAALATSRLYVDTVNEEKLVEDAIRGMLKELDPHSTYSSAEETRKLNEPLQGNFEGIGVQFNMVEDSLVVIQTVSKGPSEKVGIMAGDRIVSVNDTAIAGVKMSQDEIMKRLRGPKGSKVNLGVIRKGAKNKLNFVVSRDKIPVTTLDAAYMIRPGIGYIRLGSFGNTTHKEMMTAVKKLQKEGMQKLVLDLRDNGGGYLHSSVDIANEFLQSHDLVVYTEGLNSKKREYKANGNGMLKDVPVVVVVNQNTASAAEILTGAIQDQDRGMVVGRRTYAKGLVQRPVDLPDGSMIRLTIARYYTPSGRCIQKPYEKGDKAGYSKDLNNRLQHGELSNADSIHVDDSLKFKTLKKGRTVYGGGGIIPDVFIPLDTTRATPYYTKLVTNSIFIRTTLKFIDQHRASLKKTYPTFEKYLNEFLVGEELTALLRKEGESAGIEYNEKEYLESKHYIDLHLKGLIARDIWDMGEYYHIINEDSDEVKKAIELLQNPEEIK